MGCSNTKDENNAMTVRYIQAKKLELEDELNDIISNFEEVCGVTVSSAIFFDTVSMIHILGQKDKKITKVSVEVKL